MNSIKEVLIHLRALKKLDNVRAESLTIVFKDCEVLNNKHIIYLWKGECGGLGKLQFTALKFNPCNKSLGNQFKHLEGKMVIKTTQH